MENGTSYLLNPHRRVLGRFPSNVGVSRKHIPMKRVEDVESSRHEGSADLSQVHTNCRSQLHNRGTSELQVSVGGPTPHRKRGPGSNFDRQGPPQLRQESPKAERIQSTSMRLLSSPLLKTRSPYPSRRVVQLINVT